MFHLEDLDYGIISSTNLLMQSSTLFVILFLYPLLQAKYDKNILSLAQESYFLGFLSFILTFLPNTL